MTDKPNKPIRMPSAQESLDKIGDTLGARENNYNNPKDNFDDIAAVWTQLLKTEKIIPRDHPGLTALSVARLMVGMKLVRDAYKVKLDNWVDTAGYGVCGLRIAEFLELTEAAEKRLSSVETIAFDTPLNLVTRTGSFAFASLSQAPKLESNGQSYEDALREFYKIYSIDISKPMTHGHKILLYNYLADRGFLNDPG